MNKFDDFYCKGKKISLLDSKLISFKEQTTWFEYYFYVHDVKEVVKMTISKESNLYKKDKETGQFNSNKSEIKLKFSDFNNDPFCLLNYLISLGECCFSCKKKIDSKASLIKEYEECLNSFYSINWMERSSQKWFIKYEELYAL